MIRRFILGCTVVLALHAAFQDPARAAEQTPPPAEPWLAKSLENFQDLKFGFMMHFGAYSQWGCIESWPLVEEDKWGRPDDLKPWIERGKDLARFQRDYFALPKTFNPTKFDPVSWAKAAKDCGMKYVVYTTKHHDGFCMYDTKLTDYKITSPDCPFHAHPQADTVRAVFDAFRKEGFIIGVYFSKADWHHADYWDPARHAHTRNPNYDTAAEPAKWRRFVAFVYGQIEELMSNYGPVSLLFLDAGQVRPPKQDLDMDRLAAMARRHQPGLIIADRTVGGRYENYFTPEQEVPDKPLPHAWETCMTMGDSWSFRPNDKYKSTHRLIQLLVEIVAKGGNFLLNVGPQPDGQLPAEALSRMKEIGAWMKVNGEAIYATRPIAPYKDGSVSFTRKGNTVYAIYVAKSGTDGMPEQIGFSGLRPAAGSEVHLLGVGGSLPWRTDAAGKTTIDIPAAVRKNPPCRHAFAVKFETAKRFQAVLDADGRLIVAAVVATDPPYQADATGKTDASPAIQAAMGDAAAHGGGTVFLPAGRYRLDKHLTLPATVTLCGQWRRPEAGLPLAGTVLLAYADKNAAAGAALLSPPACGHANVFDLSIYYPEQDPLRPVPYPFSIDGRVAYVRNVTLVNSYQGIMMSNFSGGSVADIYGTVLKRGIVLKGSCELCSCCNLRFGSDYWTRLPEAAMSAEGAAAVRKFVRSELIAVQVGKVDGLSFYNASLAESKTPVLVKKESDEAKVMVAPWNQYGFGGGLAKVDGRRTDVDFDGWYFGTHYFDLDNYPQLAGKQYVFAALRQAARSGPDTVCQAGAFGVMADGSTDDSPALQRALDHAGKSGGGTVLLPRGVTVLKAPVTIPAGVELRGGYLGVPVRAWYNQISTLMIDCDADTKDAEHAPAAISLQQRAGLRGVNVSHAKNHGELDRRGRLVVHPYPYAVRGLGKDVYIYDLSMTNAYHGIDLGAVRCDGAQVVGLWGTMLHYGVRVGAGSDRVQLENINIDVGPLESDARFAAQLPAAANRHDILQAYLADHAVNFLFGDCTGLTTFHLAGFAPHQFLEFVDQGSGGCRDAQFWSSIFDVPNVELARFSAGGQIAFYGLFATGGRDHHSLWAEFDESFRGKVDVYGLCQQLSFNNRPFLVGQERLQIHLEHSLTTGRPATASSSVAGLGPENAVDGDPRTLWQSKDGKGPHELTVELAEPSMITRWRVHGAGTFLPAVENMAEAELLGSIEGSNYFPMAGFRDNRHDWVDMPVTCERPVRFVRLQVIRPQGPESSSNCARIAQFDGFCYRP